MERAQRRECRQAVMAEPKPQASFYRNSKEKNRGSRRSTRMSGREMLGREAYAEDELISRTIVALPLL
jgi:hypothetical protein